MMPEGTIVLAFFLICLSLFLFGLIILIGGIALLRERKREKKMAKTWGLSRKTFVRIINMKYI